MEKREHTTAAHRLILDKKIFLLENTGLNINKETCNCEVGKAFWFYQAANTCFQWKRQNCCVLLNKNFTGIVHIIWGCAGDL